jgi:hypothetical protein
VEANNVSAHGKCVVKRAMNPINSVKNKKLISPPERVLEAMWSRGVFR